MENKFLQRDKQQILISLLEYVNENFDSLITANYSTESEIKLEDYLKTIQELISLGHITDFNANLRFDGSNRITFKVKKSLQRFLEVGGFLSNN
jgi:hypothetical protein